MAVQVGGGRKNFRGTARRSALWRDGGHQYDAVHRRHARAADYFHGRGAPALDRRFPSSGARCTLTERLRRFRSTSRDNSSDGPADRRRDLGAQAPGGIPERHGHVYLRASKVVPYGRVAQIMAAVTAGWFQKGGAGHRADQSIAGSGFGRAAVILGLGGLERAARDDAGSPHPRLCGSAEVRGQSRNLSIPVETVSLNELNQIMARRTPGRMSRRRGPWSRSACTEAAPSRQRRLRVTPLARVSAAAQTGASASPAGTAAKAGRERAGPARAAERCSRRSRSHEIAKALEREKSEPQPEPVWSYDPNAIAKIIGQPKPQSAATASNGPGNATPLGLPHHDAPRMSVSMASALDAWLTESYLNWTPPPVMPDGDIYVAQIETVFNPDGTLDAPGPPQSAKRPCLAPTPRAPCGRSGNAIRCARPPVRACLSRSGRSRPSTSIRVKPKVEPPPQAESAMKLTSIGFLLFAVALAAGPSSATGFSVYDRVASRRRRRLLLPPVRPGALSSPLRPRRGP